MSFDLPAAENRFLNRDLSWIEFNRRVLEEGLDSTQPILERLRFLSFFSRNLDEFFMIHGARFQEEPLQLVSPRLRPILEMQSRCLKEEILPGLAQSDIRIVSHCQLTDDQRNQLDM